MLNFSSSEHALNNKIILITGAGDGIGKQAAITFASYGATCILLGRTTHKLEATYDEIMAKGYPEPAIIPLDMKGATVQNYQDMAQTIIHEYGKLDGCLHNSSIVGGLSPFIDIKPEDWAEVMQINVTATAQITQALIPALKLSNKGSVVFTSSGVGRAGRAYWGVYSISKFATEGMMQVLADEHKNTHIRFNSINPGATRTKMRASAYPSEDPSTLKTPADIMPLYVYLMSDDSQTENGKSFDCQPK